MALMTTHHFNHKGLSLSQNEQKIKKYYMKHFKAYLLCLGLALITVSCSQDDFGNGDNDSEELVEMSFIAGSSQPVTRTVLGSDGATVTWQTNDKIGIGFGNQPKNYPFTTPTAGSDVRFWGQAPNQPNPYFMMYPYQADAKITSTAPTVATYEYTLPSKQEAIAETFDPKANVSVGIIPVRHKPFTAYNTSGLLHFIITGTPDVKNIKLISRGSENVAGKITSTITFNNTGKITNINNKFTVASSSTVLSFAPASGTLEQSKDYYIVLPPTKFEQGLTLIFNLQNGKSIIKKINGPINIERAKTYNLGTLSLNTATAKEFNLTNPGLIAEVVKKFPDITKDANGHINIYDADNFEKILSFKGELAINNNSELTTLDQLQYFHYVTGLKLTNNKNLAGNLDLSKYKQLTGDVTITGSPNVTKIDITGLAVKNIDFHDMKGVKEIIMKNNNELRIAKFYGDEKLEKVDASNLPELTTLWTYSSGNVKTINTTNSPKLKEINAASNSSLTAVIGLDGNRNLEVFTVSNSKIENFDFSLQTKLRVINLTSSAAKEIKGLDKVGVSLVELVIPASQITSIDISQNPNLTKLDVNQLKGMTSLDVSHNKKLKFLKTSFTPLTSLDLSNNTNLTELNVTHNKLSSLDISHIPGLTTFRAGSQSNATNHTQVITVKMSTAQKNKFGAIFKIDGSGFDTSGENSTSYVNIIEVQ